MQRVEGVVTRYAFKADPYSSHSVMGRWLGAGRGRTLVERSLRALVRDAGLEIDRFTATPAPLSQALPAGFHRPWLAATHGINAWLAHSLPRLLGYQFIVLARRKEAQRS
jgi:hypothetical protein